MKSENLISLAGVSRQTDTPLSALRDRVSSGELTPDATSRCGKKVFVFFRPERVQQIRLLFNPKSKPLAN